MPDSGSAASAPTQSRLVIVLRIVIRLANPV
jgi:hypothetical protein